MPRRGAGQGPPSPPSARGDTHPVGAELVRAAAVHARPGPAPCPAGAGVGVGAAAADRPAVPAAASRRCLGGAAPPRRSQWSRRNVSPAPHRHRHHRPGAPPRPAAPGPRVRAPPWASGRTRSVAPPPRWHQESRGREASVGRRAAPLWATGDHRAAKMGLRLGGGTGDPSHKGRALPAPINWELIVLNTNSQRSGSGLQMKENVTKN